MTWDGLKTDPENGVVMNLNTAYAYGREGRVRYSYHPYVVPDPERPEDENFNIYLGAYASGQRFPESGR